jgi:hypothetical protein
MSQNTRLLPTRKLAATRIERDRSGKPLLPRIVERRPRHGDVHALSKRFLSVLLRYQRIDYLYGLRQIELRPRVANAVGHPYGTYLPTEQVVVLYSVPADRWRFARMSPAQADVFRSYEAVVTHDAAGACVAWPRAFDMAYFVYQEVLLHELGHHHDYQYRHKRKLPGGRRLKEVSADRHMARLSKTRGWRLWRALERRGDL